MRCGKLQFFKIKVKCNKFLQFGGGCFLVRRRFILDAASSTKAGCRHLRTNYEIAGPKRSERDSIELRDPVFVSHWRGCRFQGEELTLKGRRDRF